MSLPAHPAGADWAFRALPAWDSRLVNNACSLPPLKLPCCSANSASARPCAAAIHIVRRPIPAQPRTFLRWQSLLNEWWGDRLKDIPGVGDAIADIIIKLHKTGEHPSLQAMRKEIPAGALEMLSIPGLRPDKVLKIHNELGISSLDELEGREAGSAEVGEGPRCRAPDEDPAGH